ncbi:MAG: hypothetical protein HXX17_11845 [Geobacteraceae bacterium]|nr:hypothetical protein [Geobacteraceae bacterium]
MSLIMPILRAPFMLMGWIIIYWPAMLGYVVVTVLYDDYFILSFLCTLAFIGLFLLWGNFAEKSEAIGKILEPLSRLAGMK